LNLTAASCEPPAPGGDEDHRDEEQAAAEEHGREEPVLAVADEVPDRGDAPEESDAGEGREVDTDERDAAGVLAEVEVADLRGRASG
jgi:hypothetical protein